MNIVNFADVKEELISNIRRKMLIPVIGSGFTRGCPAQNGKVPSGEDYKEYMICEIAEMTGLSGEEVTQLQHEHFSEVSQIYHQEIPAERRRKYLKSYFTHVQIEENKKKFLSLPWPYVYTLNIDDGIEKNSKFEHVVYANREANDDVFDSYSCIVKLHGDITEMVTYADSDSQIFTQQQYVNSLKKNQYLLRKLWHDNVFQNLLFIGCSLDDELDLMTCLENSNSTDSITAKYICIVGNPSTLQELKYKKYGITHCIVFKSYDEIYDLLYQTGLEAQSVRLDDLDHFKGYSIKSLPSNFNDNTSYLLFGKSLLDKKREITRPYFFISREVTDSIINNIGKYAIQFLLGSGCSGKTYILVDLASRIKDRDVYIFETKDRITNEAFKSIINRKNCVILADNGSLSDDQIEYFILHNEQLRSNNNHVIIALDRHNRSINGILKLYEMQGKIDSKEFPRIILNNTFSSSETQRINPLLTAINVGIFSSGKTLVDNIISISEKLALKNKYYNIHPRYKTVSELAALISLATEHKIYSTRAAQLDIIDELRLQCQVSEPLIDFESTWTFEQSQADNATKKYVVNADYWLVNELEKYSCIEKNQKLIVDAYKFIISQIILLEGTPKLSYGNKNATYKMYILFDNINHIFASEHIGGEKGIFLIRAIYEGLNDLLSTDPNYMHQRAKCYIKSAYFEHDLPSKESYFEKAYRDANVALQVFESRHKETQNEKVLISIAHVQYTEALIVCHKCAINNYADIKENSTAIHLLRIALNSPYNDYSFIKHDAFNYSDVISKIIYAAVGNRYLIDENSKSDLQWIMNFIIN